MAGRGTGPDFVEALARGLDVLTCFGAGRPGMTLAEIATAAELARPTARRLLLTLAELGYVRATTARVHPDPQVLRLGIAYASSLGLWDIARPHMADAGRADPRVLLDGPARRRRTSSTSRGSRCPRSSPCGWTSAPGSRPCRPRRARSCSPRCDAGAGRGGARRAQPVRPAAVPAAGPRPLRQAELAAVRARGWALADEELAPGIRSVAVPVRDGTGTVRAAMNVTVHAAETSVEVLTGEHLPRLIAVAGEVSADWALWQSRPHADFATAGLTCCGAA